MFRSSSFVKLVVGSITLGAALAVGCAGGAAISTRPTSAAEPTKGSEFTILIYESEAQLAARTDPSRADAYWTSYDEFAGALAKAGALRGGSALSESSARTVKGTGSADRAVEGARLGGYFVVQAADLEKAVALSKLAPPSAIAVEVRPHRPNPHMAGMAPTAHGPSASNRASASNM
jgi:hypothetical protein